jgi:hypothetical protein
MLWGADVQNNLNQYNSQCYSKVFLNVGARVYILVSGILLLFVSCCVHTCYVLGDVDGSSFIQATYDVKFA